MSVAVLNQANHQWNFPAVKNAGYRCQEHKMSSQLEEIINTTNLYTIYVTHKPYVLMCVYVCMCAWACMYMYIIQIQYITRCIYITSIRHYHIQSIIINYIQLQPYITHLYILLITINCQMYIYIYCMYQRLYTPIWVNISGLVYFIVNIFSSHILSTLFNLIAYFILYLISLH